MIVIASSNGRVGIQAAVEVLGSGGSAVDAVEAGIRLVEDNPEDHSVGYGGYPNIIGEVELDASIMNGQDLQTGAVGGMRGYREAISIARKVMEELPHVFLVAEGAERFAAEMGFRKENLLSNEAERVWKKRLQDEKINLSSLETATDLRRWVRLATDPERAKGTVNFIAQDQHGHLCTGVSTSGWAWKYPGRLGDSPAIGAGNYADDRYGAAACTGMGEMAIRACSAHSVVAALRFGMSLEEAGKQAMEDLKRLGGAYRGQMNIISLDKTGQHAAFSTVAGKTYVMQRPDMSAPEELERQHIAVPERWGSF